MEEVTGFRRPAIDDFWRAPHRLRAAFAAEMETAWQSRPK
jgi:hypothetical protein